MGRRIILIVLMAGGALLAGCASSLEPAGAGVGKDVRGVTDVRGAILPHHLLVEEWMERFYSTLENPAIDRIVLISPNHFNYGASAIRTTDAGFADEGVAAHETQNFNLEHGVTVHEPFLAQHFPQARLTPVILKIGTAEERLDALADQIAALDPVRTLVIASVDFTHMDPEPVALRNDRRTLRWLKRFPRGDTGLKALRQLAETTNPDPAWDSVAFDSPESLYVLTRVMNAWGTDEFTLWERTSSASLIPGLDPSQNTSHLFGTFRPQGTRSTSGSVSGP